MPKPLRNYSSHLPWLFPFSTLLLSSVIKLRSWYRFWLFSVSHSLCAFTKFYCPLLQNVFLESSKLSISQYVLDPTFLCLESCNCFTLPLTISSTLKALNTTPMSKTQNSLDEPQSPIQSRLLCLSGLNLLLFFTHSIQLHWSPCCS